MAFIAEHLSLEKLRPIKKSLDELNLPSSPARGLLAYLHSGEVLRHALPSLLRIGGIVWLFLFVLIWFAVWPANYEEFERWGLVKSFFAQMITLVTAFLVLRITMLRAGHIRTLPLDDFVSLRALAALFRWVGEIALVYTVGRGLSSLLQPVSAPMNSILGSLSPSAGGAVSSGTTSLLLFSAPFSLFFVSVAASLFLGLYSAATAIDVYLAIEFNTRAERMGKGVSLGGL
jgi:hypothetical protein